MAKNVTSQDLRKPAIVAALKKASGGNRVTLVKQLDTNTFRGNCLLYVGNGNGDVNGYGERSSYKTLGQFEVVIDFNKA